MTCLYVPERLIFQHADGQLTGRSLRLVEGHLAACAECAHAAGGFRGVIDAISDDTRAVPNDAIDPLGDLAVTRGDVDWFAIAFADAVTSRQTKRMAALIAGHFDVLTNLAPAQPYAAETLAHLALALEVVGHFGQEVAFTYTDLAAMVLRRFEPRPPADMTLREFVYLELARGLLAPAVGRPGRAIGHLRTVVRLAPRLDDLRIVIIASDALAKGLCRQGKYRRALGHARRALRLARRSTRDELVAHAELRIAWITLQMKDGDAHAEAPLRRASAILQDTENYLDRGNARAALAKMAAHRGLSLDAIAEYDAACAEYEQVDRQHPNLARALVNRAQTKLFVALRLRDTSTAPTDDSNTRAVAARRLFNIADLERQASGDLDEARRIFQGIRDARGQGSVAIVTARLHLNRSEDDLALHHANEAYELGRRTADDILMARARLQQCRIARAMCHADAAGRDAHVLLERARTFSDEAVRRTDRMQHSRLSAVAHIWAGLTLIQPYFGDTLAAARCRDQACELLDPATRDYVWHELRLLDDALTRQGHARFGAGATQPSSMWPH